jgi:AraC-like DNA-binding protein
VSNVLQKTAKEYDPRGRLNPASFERTIHFAILVPPESLKPFIEHFWVIRWKDIKDTYYSEEVMHRPYVDLFISAKESGIQGTFRGKRTYEAVGNGIILGARFKPGAFHAFWDGTISELQDRNIDLERLFPKITSSAIKELLELDDKAAAAQLAEYIQAAQPTPDKTIDFINKIILAIENDADLLTVTDIAKRFGRSERVLQQLFSDYLGIGLKWLLKRQKLLTAAEQIRKIDHPNWTALAYELGYSSQQHFITDFKHVTGKTPVQYKKSLV